MQYGNNGAGRAVELTVEAAVEALDLCWPLLSAMVEVELHPLEVTTGTPGRNGRRRFTAGIVRPKL